MKYKKTKIFFYKKELLASPPCLGLGLKFTMVKFAFDLPYFFNPLDLFLVFYKFLFDCILIEGGRTPLNFTKH